MARVDLTLDSITALTALGFSDRSQGANSFDPSDQSNRVLFGAYDNVRSLHQPDGISAFRTNGRTYMAYTAYNEEVRLGNVAYPLDSVAFPARTFLKNNNVLGRLTVLNSIGDTDNDGDFDIVYTGGSRSFSIFDTTGAKVYDSGNDFEFQGQNTPTFNMSNTVAVTSRKNRSDDKGPEPEGIITERLNGRVYAFISNERSGGIFAYDVTNPAAPVFHDFKSSRTLLAGTDLGPEGLIYISPQDSPTDTAYLVTCNEVSATLTFYRLANVRRLVGIKGLSLAKENIRLYPNPMNGIAVVSFNAVGATSVLVRNATGQVVSNQQLEATGETLQPLNLQSQAPGLYFVTISNGAESTTVKLVKE
jgi:hypothetical protein